jgi:Tfp pilus assembly protein FimT
LIWLVIISSGDQASQGSNSFRESSLLRWQQLRVRKAFALLELLVLLAIVGVLLGLLAAAVLSARPHGAAIAAHRSHDRS